jgi:hypothetical protein
MLMFDMTEFVFQRVQILETEKVSKYVLRVTRAVLLKRGSVKGTVMPGQRYLKLEISSRGGRSVEDWEGPNYVLINGEKATYRFNQFHYPKVFPFSLPFSAVAALFLGFWPLPSHF